MTTLQHDHTCEDGTERSCDARSGIYALWLNGEDLRQSLPKNTFYRYRRTFLEHGIDISIVHDKHRNNIVPLVRYLEAQPADIPQWAYEKNLVA